MQQLLPAQMRVRHDGALKYYQEHGLVQKEEAENY